VKKRPPFRIRGRRLLLGKENQGRRGEKEAVSYSLRHEKRDLLIFDKRFSYQKRGPRRERPKRRTADAIAPEKGATSLAKKSTAVLLQKKGRKRRKGGDLRFRYHENSPGEEAARSQQKRKIGKRTLLLALAGERRVRHHGEKGVGHPKKRPGGEQGDIMKDVTKKSNETWLC